MTIDSIRKKIKEEGMIEAFFYYGCRACTKIQMRLAEKWIKNHASVCENRIMFKNRQMQDFTDNARALFEYLIDNGYNEKYQIIWAVSEKSKFKDYKYKNVIFVTAESKHGWSDIRAFYYGNTAKYFFYTNNTADLNRCRCKGQVVVNLWHGCGYKGAIHDKADIPRSKTMEMFDYALVPGPVFVKTKSRYWEVDESKILPLGYPRYDWLLSEENHQEQILHKLFDREETFRKVVIWMPTFRKCSLTGYAENGIELPFELPGLSGLEELQELNRFCEALNILLIIKKHPLQTGWKDAHDLKNVCYISDEMLKEKEVQLYRLVGVCDALVSDYSSIAVDYLLMDRPLGFVLADCEEYGLTRGFVFENPLEYMPGEKIYDLKDMKAFLENVSLGRDVWSARRQEILPQMHNVTENYCKRIVDKIFNDK